MNIKLVIYLIADNDGDLIEKAAKIVVSRFNDLEVEYRLKPMILTKMQIESIANDLKKAGVVIFYLINDDELRQYLKNFCITNQIKHISVLSHPIVEMASIIGQPTTRYLPSRQDLDESYFSKMELINFAITHDDGHISDDYSRADIILFGVSRSSKTPTSIYLANRGYYVANIPIHQYQQLDSKIWQGGHALLIGLTMSATRLVELRKNRALTSSGNTKSGRYTNINDVEEELLHAGKLFNQHQISIIDITRRSVEETASIIITKYNEIHQSK
ncbi:MAG: pyruvate, phosphate dikinase/phosphoenolpyruvate synthase regulator [Pseudomonadota bacterium]